jgi:hypothetical protein
MKLFDVEIYDCSLIENIRSGWINGDIIQGPLQKDTNVKQNETVCVTPSKKNILLRKILLQLECSLPVYPSL